MSSNKYNKKQYSKEELLSSEEQNSTYGGFNNEYSLPIGSIVDRLSPFDENNPKGCYKQIGDFLNCDGSEVRKEDYPELYKYFKEIKFDGYIGAVNQSDDYFSLPFIKHTDLSYHNSKYRVYKYIKCK